MPASGACSLEACGSLYDTTTEPLCTLSGALGDFAELFKALGSLPALFSNLTLLSVSFALARLREHSSKP